MRTAIPELSLEQAFERRADRAAALEACSPVAAEPLRFAAGLYREQGRLGAQLERRQLSGRLESDVGLLLESSEALLRYAAGQGPPQLSQDARAPVGEARLLDYWRSESNHDYLARALLRPYAELLSRLGTAPDRARRAYACPFCGGRPWIAARRPAPEADAALRLLGCALCGGDWPVGRIQCSGCGEDDPAKLPSFTEPTHPSVRLEACESCRAYVKSIDLTRDARAIPEVDDLVSLGMDLWAAREGLTRLEPGLVGF